MDCKSVGSAFAGSSPARPTFSIGRGSTRIARICIGTPLAATLWCQGGLFISGTNGTSGTSGTIACRGEAVMGGTFRLTRFVLCLKANRNARYHYISEI